MRQYTSQTIAFKAREAFSAMDAETRAEYLTSGKFQQDGNTVDKLTWKLSPYELIALNTALGVSFEEYKDIREGYHAIASLKSCIRRAVRSAHSVNEAKAPVVEISKPESKSVAAFKQWEENFKGKDEFAFYATNDYLALLDVIAASKEVVSKKVDTYAAHWYIESGRSSREFRRALLNTDPRKIVKFLNAAVSENTDNQVNAMRIAMGLATAESISWQERITQRRISKLIASLETEHEVKPDYDAAFDETAYTPDVQEGSVIVDDIPVDHEPETQEVKPAQPAKFMIGRHYQSRGLDKGTVTFLGKVNRDYGYFVDSLNCYHRVKIVSDSTGEYASIAHKSGSFPADRVNAVHEVSEHEILSVANGTSVLLNSENVIHSYQELEAKLATKPVPVQEGRKTAYERRLEERKELQAEIHKLWQKRHALNKAQRVFGEGSADAEALSDIWGMYHDQADVLLGEYWRVCEALAQERECLRRDEADSQLAGTLAITEAVTHSKPEVQPMQTSKSKATLSTKKKPMKVSRKSHTQYWEQFSQSKSKTSRHNPNSKPLIKATRAALSVRIKKF